MKQIIVRKSFKSKDTRSENEKTSHQKDRQNCAPPKHEHGGLTTPVLRRLHALNGTRRTGKDCITALRNIGLNRLEEITKRSARYASLTSRTIVLRAHVHQVLKQEDRPKLQIYI